jgi:glutamate dehydrogenase
VGRWAAIDALDAGLERDVEAELVAGVERLVETVTRWYLGHASDGPLEAIVEAGHEGFERLEDALEETLPTGAAETVERLVAVGVPEPLAEAHALAGELAFAPDVIAVAQDTGRAVEEVGVTFAQIGRRLRFDWLESELDGLPAAQRTQRWALQALRDDAHRARRLLAARALAETPEASGGEAIDAFLARRGPRCRHLDAVMRSLTVDGSDLAGLMIAVRELHGLAA